VFDLFVASATHLVKHPVFPTKLDTWAVALVAVVAVARFSEQ
jgi:hypothetical protein